MSGTNLISYGVFVRAEGPKTGPESKGEKKYGNSNVPNWWTIKKKTAGLFLGKGAQGGGGPHFLSRGGGHKKKTPPQKTRGGPGAGGGRRGGAKKRAGAQKGVRPRGDFLFSLAVFGQIPLGYAEGRHPIGKQMGGVRGSGIFLFGGPTFGSLPDIGPIIHYATTRFCYLTVSAGTKQDRGTNHQPFGATILSG